MSERKLPAKHNGNARWQKGMPKIGGRTVGTPNVATDFMREMMRRGAEAVGFDGKGKGGYVGWLVYMCLRYPKEYLKVMAKLEPRAVTLDQTLNLDVTYKTVEEARQALREQGIVIEHEVLQ